MHNTTLLIAHCLEKKCACATSAATLAKVSSASCSTPGAAIRMRKKILLFGLVAALVVLSGCIESQEEDECADLSGFEKDYCYAEKAAQDLEATGCFKVEDQEIQDDCYLAIAALGGDYRCGDIEDDTKYDTCQYMRSITFVKDEYCYNIRSEETKQQCYDDVAKKKP